MNYNNRGNQQIYGTGCSLFGCLIAILFFGFILRGSIFFFFQYFWLILILGVVVWVFRKFVRSDDDSDSDQNDRQKRNWSRDFENQEDTGYDNYDRDFEEVDIEGDSDDSDKEDKNDEFSDF